ncbi:MAG: alkaline phosphatase [Armatimonadota bacterium]
MTIQALSFRKIVLKTSILLALIIVFTCSFACAAGKNYIIMIADGAGFNHFYAGSIYLSGSPESQVYDDFPVKLAMSTYPYGGEYDTNKIWTDFDAAKSGATDSAAAATAMACGVKTINGTIGMDHDKKPVKNILEIAKEYNKSTGVITTVGFSHATPAGFAAHAENRSHFYIIANQMINKSDLDVIIGAGHPYYDNDSNKIETPNFSFFGNEKLYKELSTGKAGGNRPWTFIENREDFVKLSSGGTPERLFGLAKIPASLQFYRKNIENPEPFTAPLIDSVPTLAEMSLAGLNVLGKNENGFVVMIEGGAIDAAGHGNNSVRLIEEQVDFVKAIDAVCEWIEKNSSWEDTLLIITADHETGHLTGPGSNPAWNPLVNNGKGNLPGMQWHSRGHTNHLVPFYAKGKDANLFVEKHIVAEDKIRGKYIDNTSISKVIAESMAK